MASPEPPPFLIISLYRFISTVSIAPTHPPSHVDYDPKKPHSAVLYDLRDEVHAQMLSLDATGLILLASEGINGTVCIPLRNETSFVVFFERHAHFGGGSGGEGGGPGRRRMRVGDYWGEGGRTGVVAAPAFDRMRVRVKGHIVTLKVPDGAEVDPLGGVGTYVDARGWNDVISDPDVLVVDCRNMVSSFVFSMNNFKNISYYMFCKYEIGLGTFEGAVDPGTEIFNDFPAWLLQAVKERMDLEDGWDEVVGSCEEAAKNEGPKPTKLAMFCTGGIRCEKSTSFAVMSGILPPDKVYHLDG